MPGRLWFSLDEAKQELWKSPNESSSSRRGAGDVRYLQEEWENHITSLALAQPPSRSEERRNGELDKAP